MWRSSCRAAFAFWFLLNSHTAPYERSGPYDSPEMCEVLRAAAANLESRRVSRCAEDGTFVEAELSSWMVYLSLSEKFDASPPRFDNGADKYLVNQGELRRMEFPPKPIFP